MSIEGLIEAAIAADGVISDAVKEELSSQSLLSICQYLRDYLCGEKSVQAAMRLLASVAIGRSDLGKVEMQYLFRFFAEKLAQQELQATALSSLALLVSDMGERLVCDEDMFKTVGVPLVEHVRVQHMPLNSRKQCFTVVSFLFSECTMPLCDTDVLSALLEMIDGESDPELVLQGFHLHYLTATCSTKNAFDTVRGDYFESVSSYFPIIFSQPPGCAVTKAELRAQLKKCLSLSVYSELCIPFMQGKLASPSTAVKEDVLEVLLMCFETYHPTALVPHYRSLVVDMKNEVVKLSSFVDHTPSETLNRCMHMGCELLGCISEQCAVHTQAEALDLFGPVVEGFLSALSANTSTCTTYATLVFHILTGAWDCCVHVASYLFSMLAMSLAEPEHPSNTYILFAALLSGMLDSLNAFPSEAHVEQLRSCMKKPTQTVMEVLPLCVREWRGSVTDGRMDDFVLVCGCEFLVSILKFSSVMEAWAPATVESECFDTLVWVALHGSAEVSSKACRLLRDQGGANGAKLQAALERLLTHTSVPPQQGLSLVCEVAKTSPAALLFAFQRGLFPDAGVWIMEASAGSRATALKSALEHFKDTLPESIAGQMMTRLCRADVPPEFLECACLVAGRLSGAVCEELLSDEHAVSPLGIAALVSRSSALPPVHRDWIHLAEHFVELANRDSAVWRRVGMEGITGLTANYLTWKDVPTLSLTMSSEAFLDVAVATLWGRLLRDGSHPGDEFVDPRELVLGFMRRYVMTPTDASPRDLDSIAEAFSYVPFLATRIPDRPSLLLLLLRGDSANSLRVSPAFCTALRHLVEGESRSQIRACLEALLDVVSSLAGSSDTEERILARELLFSIDSGCGNNADVARPVLYSQANVRAILEGAESSKLTTRCRSLELLTTMARHAPKLLTTCTPDEKSLLRGARETILLATKQPLGDRKRRVRQAAASCRHEWFKMK